MDDEHVEATLDLVQGDLMRCEDTALYRAVVRLVEVVTWLAEPSVTASTAGLPITESPTMEALSAAAAPASTDQRTLASSRSDPLTTHASLVVPSSECAHEWRDWFAMVNGSRVDLTAGKSETVWCRCCGALRLYGKIVVPAVAPASSTSQSPASQH